MTICGGLVPPSATRGPSDPKGRGRWVRTEKGRGDRIKLIRRKNHREGEMEGPKKEAGTRGVNTN